MTLCKHFMFKKKYLLNYRLLLWIAKGKIVLMDLTVNMCEITPIIDCEWYAKKNKKSYRNYSMHLLYVEDI